MSTKKNLQINIKKFFCSNYNEFIQYNNRESNNEPFDILERSLDSILINFPFLIHKNIQLHQMNYTKERSEFFINDNICIFIAFSRFSDTLYFFFATNSTSRLCFPLIKNEWNKFSLVKKIQRMQPHCFFNGKKIEWSVFSIFQENIMWNNSIFTLKMYSFLVYI